MMSTAFTRRTFLAASAGAVTSLVVTTRPEAVEADVASHADRRRPRPDGEKRDTAGDGLGPVAG